MGRGRGTTSNLGCKPGEEKRVESRDRVYDLIATGYVL